MVLGQTFLPENKIKQHHLRVKRRKTMHGKKAFATNCALEADDNKIIKKKFFLSRHGKILRL